MLCIFIFLKYLCCSLCSFFCPRNGLNEFGDGGPSEFHTDPHMMHKKVRVTVYRILSYVKFTISQHLA